DEGGAGGAGDVLDEGADIGAPHVESGCVGVGGCGRRLLGEERQQRLQAECQHQQAGGGAVARGGVGHWGNLKVVVWIRPSRRSPIASSGRPSSSCGSRGRRSGVSGGPWTDSNPSPGCRPTPCSSAAWPVSPTRMPVAEAVVLVRVSGAGAGVST